LCILILYPHLRLCFPCGLFPSDFPSKILYGHLSPILPRAPPLSLSL
jgi:hypothetical protein